VRLRAFRLSRYVFPPDTPGRCAPSEHWRSAYSKHSVGTAGTHRALRLRVLAARREPFELGLLSAPGVAALQLLAVELGEHREEERPPELVVRCLRLGVELRLHERYVG
jgi:hypothetical protein